MNYKKFQDIELSRLGLGNMRLPAVDPNAAEVQIDHPEAIKLIHKAFDEGITYFDTAYVYNSGDSEVTVGEAIQDMDRDKFYLATKWNLGANPDYKAVFEEQLKRLQTDHIDFYLIHCIMDGNCDQYLESGGIEYFLDLKKQGKIKYLGFSSHASVETLEKFASHHDWDFAQIQFNYYDYFYTTAKAEYEVLEKKNIPIMVMEPVRGGRLADLTPDANAILKKAHPDWSIATWALRFVKSFPQIQTILSGMSNMEQLMDNLGTFADDQGLNDAEMATLKEAADLFKSQLLVPCTSCRYCTEGCPMNINIPEFLKIYNDYKLNGDYVLKRVEKVESEGKPGDCIGCGACTGHCPQNIDTPAIMKELGEALAK